MDGDRLEVAAEGLADRHGPGEPAGAAQPVDGAREREGQGPAVGGDVGDERVGTHLPHPGDDRGERGVQVGHDHGHAVEVVGVAQGLVVRGVLLVDAEHGHLQRRVARLDQVARTVGVGRQPAGETGDQGVATGAEVEVERGHVQEHLVAHPRVAHDVDVRERPYPRRTAQRPRR